MFMDKTVIQEIEQCLRRMDLPVHRKSIKGGPSIDWLKKNLEQYNKNHPQFSHVMYLLGQVKS